MLMAAGSLWLHGEEEREREVQEMPGRRRSALGGMCRTAKGEQHQRQFNHSDGSETRTKGAVSYASQR